METRRRSRRRLNPRNTETKKSLHLPEEIVEEILANVVVKSLLRFKCVSKRWCSLISSERFIEIHLEKSKKNTSMAHHGVIFTGCRSSVVKQFSLQPLLNDPSLEPSPIFDPDTHRRNAGYIVGHCNGLVCIMKQHSLFLWNPATRISRKIRQGGWVPDTNLGFGWDEESGAYKVADIGSNRKCNVYSSKTDSWKSIGQNDHGFLYGRGELLGGKLHWLGGSQKNVANYVVTLEMKSEAFGKMELPCCGGALVQTLAVLRGFLSFLTHNAKGLGLDLWVMKDYGVKESWENVMKIPLEFSPPKFIIPLYMGVNGEILLLCESTFLVYNPHRDQDVSSLLMEIKRKRPFRWYYSKRSAFVYTKTLISPFASSPES